MFRQHIQHLLCRPDDILFMSLEKRINFSMQENTIIQEPVRVMMRVRVMIRVRVRKISKYKSFIKGQPTVDIVGRHRSARCKRNEYFI